MAFRILWGIKMYRAACLTLIRFIFVSYINPLIRSFPYTFETPPEKNNVLAILDQSTTDNTSIVFKILQQVASVGIAHDNIKKQFYQVFQVIIKTRTTIAYLL